MVEKYLFFFLMFNILSHQRNEVWLGAGRYGKKRGWRSWLIKKIWKGPVESYCFINLLKKTIFKSEWRHSEWVANTPPKSQMLLNENPSSKYGIFVYDLLLVNKAPEGTRQYRLLPLSLDVHPPTGKALLLKKPHAQGVWHWGGRPDLSWKFAILLGGLLSAM